jgi:excisionase family DNA binding protein
MGNSKVSIKNQAATVDGNGDFTECACATISVNETAKIIGCAVSTLYQAIKEDKFPAIKIGGTIRVPLPALEQMLATGKMNPTVKETHVCVDENMAQRVAEIIAMKMLLMEQQRIAEQVKTMSGGVYLYGSLGDATAK